MILLSRSGKLEWKPGHRFSRKSLLAKFGRQLMCDGHIFQYSTPSHIVNSDLAIAAAARSLPARDGTGSRWKARYLLTKAARSRLHDFDAAMEKANTGDEKTPRLPVFFDVSQNLSFSDISINVPALTRRNVVWSTHFDRPLLMQERLEVMGVPAMQAESTLGMATPFPKTQATLKKTQLSELTGNSMQLAAISAVLIYTLSFTQRKS